jgi:CubicO group peptidase (beta-lactamase class C family)
LPDILAEAGRGPPVGEDKVGGLQRVLDGAVAAGDVPFAVGMTANAGGVTWAGAAGERAPGAAAAPDTVFHIFSMTKAVGCTAALILIDRGLLDPDTPVADILPEFRAVRVLDGWDGDRPRLRAPRTVCTIRQLATHTSGFEYQFWNADIARYLEVTGLPSIVTGQRKSMYYPLTFDPGTRWGYGPGIDWLGAAVEQVDGRRIDLFLEQEIFGPLGMRDTGCELLPHMAPRLARARARTPDGGFADIGLAPPARPQLYGMGHQLASTPQDYMRFLRMWLGRGSLDGTRILSEAIVEQASANQIGAIPIPRLRSVAPAVTDDAEFFPGVAKSHAFAFERMEADVPGMRRAGSLFWAGVLNTHYWIDPKSQLAGLIMTQSLPFAEPRFMKTYLAFERAAYAA